MLLDRLAATIEPHRLYTNEETTTVLLPRDVRPTLLRVAAFVFAALALVAMLDTAASGGAAGRWMLLWALLAALCLVLARKDTAAQRHATLVIRRSREDEQFAETGLFIDGLEVARSETQFDDFRVYKVSADRPGFLRARLSYWVMLMSTTLAVPPYQTRLPGLGPRAAGLRIERCLHPEDAARLVRQLQAAAGAPLELLERPVELHST